MNEPGENGTQPGDTQRPRDGALDFGSYSLQQLRDLEHLIDPAAQPRNHANLLAEISRRSSLAAQDEEEGPGTPGRFSARDGWLGWLDAKRRRSPVFGAGRLEITDQQVTLHGWQRTWLGIREPGVVHLPLENIRNAARDGEWLQFESKRRLRPGRKIQFKAASATAAEASAQRLPCTQSAGFEKRWQEMRTFHARVAALGGNAWAVYGLLLANVAVFAAMTFAEKQPGHFDVPVLITWGGSFGPAVIEGQWWRLISAQFIHGDLLHLMANMWVLFNAGRLARKLFGTTAFLALYFGAGICGYVASIAWNPGVVAVGASGAIFGVLGAFLAFLLRQRAQLPAALLRAHWASTLVFVGFNLVSGALHPNVDNAGHVGGLFGGFILGWFLARPLLPEVRARWPAWRYACSLALVAAVALAGYFQVRGIGLQPNYLQKFMRESDWYVSGEREALQKWQQLANRMSFGAVSEAEMSRQFLTEIYPFWQSAYQRLSTDPQFKNAEPGTFPAVLLEFARLRRDWSKAIGDATADRNEERALDSIRLMNEAGPLQAQLDRLTLRAQMEYRPRALAHSLFANRVRALFNPRGWQCIEEPSSSGRVRSADDSTEDAPALRHEAGCRAQRYFYERDYEALETLMRDAAANLNDLPDGGSSITALFEALSDFISYGGHDVESLMGRTADWRRAVPDPLMSELVEVLIFRDWAWAARGQYSSTEVSGQAWALFAHRSQMAAAGLASLEKTALDSALWHELSIGVALDLSDDVPRIRGIFNRGIERFPTYLPLYSGMLRVLMPRWLGSHEEVAQLITDVTRWNYHDQDLELYALLYWRYFQLEQDGLNIFVETRANWTDMDIGFAALLDRHPRSDYLLNVYALMACVAGDRERYATLRPQVEKRKSASAWSAEYPLASCDRKMRYAQ